MIRTMFSSMLVVLSLASGLLGQPVQMTDLMAFDKGKVVDEVARHVAEKFYSKSFDQEAWNRRVQETRPRAVAAATLDQFADEMNALLATLNASHTYYFSRLNPKRYQVLGVFHPLYDADDTSLFVYSGIGIDTKIVDSKVFVSAVFDGFPAAEARLKYGDQIVSVNNQTFHPILSFAGKNNSSVKVKVLRGDTEKTIDIPVTELDGRTMFEKAMEASARTIERNGKNVGYIHIWLYAGSKYQDKLKETIFWGKLSECDSLILDLRDGWGGASINYVNLFRPPIANIVSEARSGQPQNYNGVWGKPVVLITNGGSTSGKELFSFGFKKLKLGKIVGETTAGAVLGGRAILLSNRDFLYVAVNDVSVDGKRLEGIGVSPDIQVKRRLTDGQKRDPQIQRALESLTN